MIRANPNLQGFIWSCCDFGPTGAIPAIRASGKDITVYALHGIPSSIPQAKTGLAVLEVADYQKGGIIAIDQLARHFATGARIAKKTPPQYAYKMTIVDNAERRQGIPVSDRPDAQRLRGQVEEAVRAASPIAGRPASRSSRPAGGTRRDHGD